jgi:hypothetical protein
MYLSKEERSQLNRLPINDRRKVLAAIFASEAERFVEGDEPEEIAARTAVFEWFHYRGIDAAPGPESPKASGDVAGWMLELFGKARDACQGGDRLGRLHTNADDVDLTFCNWHSIWRMGALVWTAYRTPGHVHVATTELGRRVLGCA